MKYQTKFPKCPTCGKMTLEFQDSWMCTGEMHVFLKSEYRIVNCKIVKRIKRGSAGQTETRRAVE